ncbi:BON domain-containing protein [Methylomonas sp. UP202]|uniref:BON domain-containing protein n=1 Tax=Methylomonas sp. UP202 TaxID=3040943 RepID=UPI0024783E68|nr:BON domain-containing protein [Methylomonas sp. UP202]WGS88204.1 BON domain-containing protein [Methylomonas sp. UP202]
MNILFKYSNRPWFNRLLTTVCLSAVAGLSACQPEGQAEKTGQKIDKAVENVGQKMEQGADKAGAYIEKSAQSSEDALEKASKQIDQAISNSEKRIDSAKEAVVDSAKAGGVYLDDSAITAKIKAALMSDELLKDARIEVTTVNGGVTLSGVLDNEKMVGRAIGLANSQEHVKSVQSQLAVTAGELGKP